MKEKRKAARQERKVKLNKSDNRKQRDARLEVKVGYAFDTADAAAGISGDAAVSCRLPGGSRALILSDGMGKGIKAAADSRLVIRRLRKNLQEGMQVSGAIKEVNRYMIEKNMRQAEKDGEDPEDKFATVDLTIVDLRQRKVKFYKMGAATSFLVRGGRVIRIEASALPVGIIPRLRLSGISRDLCPGDMIVVVSDGITDSDRQDPDARWLETYLTSAARQAPPRQAARHILDAAQANYRAAGREKDDLTVIAAVISEESRDGHQVCRDGR